MHIFRRLCSVLHKNSRLCNSFLHTPKKTHLVQHQFASFMPNFALWLRGKRQTTIVYIFIKFLIISIMKASAYEVGKTYTNTNTNEEMTITGKHRAGEQRGAKTIWHIAVLHADGTTTEMEKDSEQIKRIFWGEKKEYTGQTTGTRVALTAEAIAKKVAGEWQKLSSAMKVCNDFGLSIWTEEEDFVASRTKYWTAEAIRIEAEKKAKAEATKEEKAKKKAALDALAKLSPEQLAALVAGLK